MAAGMVGKVAGSVGLDAGKIQNFTNQAVNQIQATRQGGVNAGLVSVSGATPTRQPIAGITSKSAGVQVDKTIVGTDVTKAELKADKTIVGADVVKAELKADKPMAIASATIEETDQKVNMEKAKSLAVKAAQNSSKKIIQKTQAKPSSVVEQVAKAKALRNISVDRASVPAAKSIRERQNSSEINIPEDVVPVKIQRQQFKSSFGYGKLQNITPLSFASLSITNKSNKTPENLMILPKFISMYCELDYEEASTDENMDKCLKKINTIATSSVSEDVSKTQIDEAAKDFHNGYVEYLAATYFEAFEIYNDSLTFKNNELDLFTTTPANDIDASWVLAKEMHAILGERINKLRQLWARTLGMKMYSTYMDERFVEKKEKAK
jgi:hypothetical protein